MALWKPFRGNRASLDTIEKHDGYVYFCIDDGSLFFDYVDAEGNLQRKQISAKDAETLTGASLSTILNSSDIEIPTSKAVLDALAEAVKDLVTEEYVETFALNNQADWSVNDETSAAYVKNRTHWAGDPYDTTVFTEQNVAFTYNSAMGMSIAQFTLIEAISVNDQCTINWGEDVYHLTAQPYNNSNIIIGNLSLANMGDDTGEPFVIGIIENACVMYSNDTSDTTRPISILCTKQDYHKLGREYFPDNAILPVIYEGSDEHILKVKNGTWVIDHPVGMTDSDGSGEIFNSYYGDFINEAGIYAHAEGYITKALGQYSHAEGAGTIANSLGQHVHGIYNIEDDGEPELPDHPTRSRKKYVHIVGNGTNNQKRSNAHTLDWSGNAWFAGNVKVGGTGQDDIAAKILATQEYVQSFLPKSTTVTITAANWTGSTNPWSQVVSMNGVTANSKVDPQPTALQIVALQDAEITLMFQNDNGVVTAWAIGNKPTEDYTMDVLITEVVRV